MTNRFFFQYYGQGAYNYTKHITGLTRLVAAVETI